MAKLHQSNKTRLYQLESGFVVPSVTEVLKITEKSYLDAWRRKVGREEVERVTRTATQLGTKVHAMAARIVWEPRGRSANVEPDLEPYAKAVRQFLRKHVLTPLNTELQLVSQRERVGGTLDLYCVLKDGSRAVVDWKTSAQLSREHGLQTALYALLLKDSGYAVNQRLVVRLKKDKPGEWYVRTYKNHLNDVRAARAAVELWWWQNSLKVDKQLKATGSD